MPKYHNKKTQVDNKWFDSQKEAYRYLELKGKLRRGKITDLNLQVTFTLTVNGLKICEYVADFTYYEATLPCQLVVEDCKGMRTRVYNLKKKLLRAIFGITIRET
jgi:hypothetical protein